MQYRSLNNLTTAIRAHLHEIPKVDVVVGIPRSGMIAASIIATMSDQRLAGANELIEKAWRSSLHSGRWTAVVSADSILLVDDSISGGETMTRVLADLHTACPNAKITTLACYRKPWSPAVDISFETVEAPRVFEWNWYRHPFVKTAVLDIDGVISTQTYPGQRELGKPLFIPKYKVLALATGRREEERAGTEAWLSRHNVHYEKLFMSTELWHAPATKIRAIQETGVNWMVESGPKQAKHIAEYTRKSVLCIDSSTMF